MEEISCGVLQGSFLGPLLFLIYINDFAICLQSGEAIVYVDDTAISYSSKSVGIGELSAKLSNDLRCLEDWLHVSKLSSNVIKTQAM